MNKTFLIIRREYLTRVKKKSFIVMTILGPLLMAAMVIVPIYIATISNEMKTISVIDETELFLGKFKESDKVLPKRILRRQVIMHFYTFQRQARACRPMRFSILKAR